MVWWSNVSKLPDCFTVYSALNMALGETEAETPLAQWTLLPLSNIWLLVST